MLNNKKHWQQKYQQHERKSFAITKMMNLIALSLTATSLVVSGLFSPAPQNNHAGNDDQVIVKGGRRAVVVEYGGDNVGGGGEGNTKVSIGSMDEKLLHAAASVAGVAQDVKGKAQEGLHGGLPREVWNKAKGKENEAEEGVEEGVEEVVEKGKGLGSKAGRKAEEGVEGVKEKVKAKANEAMARESVEKVKGKTSEMARESVEKLKGKTSEMARESVEKLKGKTSEMARESVDKMKGKTEMVDETGKKIEKGKKELSDTAKIGKEMVSDGVSNVFSVGYRLIKEALRSMMNVMQLLGFSVAYGTSLWVSFIMSYVLAKVLPRQQFGMVQSKIYPVYFKAMVGSIGLALLGQLLGQMGKHFRSSSDMFQGYNLMCSLIFVLGNLLFLEPRATKVMLHRMKLEKEEGRGRDRTNAPTRVIDTVVGDYSSPIPTTTTTTTTTDATTTDATTAPTTTTTSVEDESKSRLAKLDNRLKKLNSYSSFLDIMTLMGLTWHLVYLSQRLKATC